MIPTFGLLVFIAIPIVFFVGLVLIPIRIALAKRKVIGNLDEVEDRRTAWRRVGIFLGVITVANVSDPIAQLERCSLVECLAPVIIIAKSLMLYLRGHRAAESGRTPHDRGITGGAAGACVTCPKRIPLSDGFGRCG